MKVIVEIADDEAKFGMQVLNSLSFVKKAIPITKEKAKIWDDLKKSAEEVQLYKEGKIKLKSAHSLLNEL